MLIPSKLSQKGLIQDPYELFMGEKSQLFLKKLEAEEHLNDRIIEQIIYGNTDNSQTYRKLKSRFRRRLIDEIYYGTFEKYNTGVRNQTMALLLKQFSVAMALKLDLFTNAYIYTIKEIHTKAKKFDLTMISQLTVHELFYYYAFVNPDKKLMLQYKTEKEKVAEQVVYSDRAEAINGELSYIFTQEKYNPSKENRIIIRERIQEINELSKRSDNFTLNVYKYDLSYYYYLVEKKYEELLILSEEAKIYYDNKQILDKFFKWSQESNKIYALILLKRYEKAELAIESTFSWLTPGVRAWFYLSDFLFICYAMQSKFESAADLVTKVLTQPSLKNFTFEITQWESRFILLSLLASESKVQEKFSEVNYKLTPQRFLKKHSDLLKDKKAMNLTYRIIEIAFYIKNNKMGKVIDIIENLGQFKYKYLRDNDTYRAQCFIRLLEVLAKSNFHPVRVNYLAEPILKKMKTKEAIISSENAYAEILPFEEIWQRLIKLL